MAFSSWRARALFLSATALMSGLGAWTMSATAATNTRVTFTSEDERSDLCVDPIRVEGFFDGIEHLYFDRAGNLIRVAITGKTRLTITNLVTGATVRPNATGPLTIDLVTGDTFARGGTVGVNPDGQLVATNGRIVVDAAGNETFLAGNERSLCEQLGTTPA